MQEDLSWMLGNILKVPGARHALLASADGLKRGMTEDLHPDLADRAAAAMSVLQSISRSAADFVGPEEEPRWRQTVVEFDHGWLFLVAAGSGAYLAVSASVDVDMEGITFRMHQLVQSLGEEMTTPLRETADGT
ncbi:roadblock/LC7 domain-containing protein [Streptomyces sp. DH37]|jgi:predicted regulator of Ras-like GTPase activity (Roadblock/LC7/MglB family)|uniref:roadblock/LC7 domain-containing protein n=1 Tax=Streptomyces sp. DH37 TaxID=3040122 RepID=UPI0024419C0D|nr:roadblock/LC7 domain-containing protein [Streptomyces sp. DH37]MDG9702607.1 roadblock/LC7 domain-containing protein [Streptomyces sp. DH37]